MIMFESMAAGRGAGMAELAVRAWPSWRCGHGRVGCAGVAESWCP
ncbi:MAG TPA: hypothetical protein VHV09_19585 [Trebonia sp.]|nr:hypothetical protein [Trebonia sp.]